MYYTRGVFDIRIKFQRMFNKMLAHFSMFPVLGFILVSSNFFNLSEVFQL